jgi:hypothetical protein
VVERARTLVRITGLAAAALTAGSIVVYGLVLFSEPGQGVTSRVVLVVTVLVAAAGAAVLAAFSESPAGAGWLAASAGVLLVLGVLALMSIGILFVAAGIFAAVGAVREASARRARRIAALGFLLGAMAALLPLLGSLRG